MQAVIREVEFPGNLAGRIDQMFPKLMEAQIHRIAARGRLRKVEAGEVLTEAGQQNFSFFVILSCRTRTVRPSEEGDTQIRVHEPGEFTGEVSLLAGRPTFVRISVIDPGELIEVNREQLLTLVQTDYELGEILM